MSMKQRLPFPVLLALLVAFALIGGATFWRRESVDIGDIGVLPNPVHVRGGVPALKRLSAEMKQHPRANSFSIRWRELDAKGVAHKYELFYNRFTGTLDYMNYSVQQTPILACQKVQDNSIHIAATDNRVASEDIDWIVPFSWNGCSCQNKQEILY